MGIRSAELKALITNELGAGFEDILEASQAEVSRWEGSKRAFKQGAESVLGLLEHVKKDVLEEKYGQETAEVVQRYVQRASAALTNLRIGAESMKLKAQGKVDGLTLVVEATKKMHDKATARVGELKDHEVGLLSERRVVGTHPGPSLRSQRDSEALVSGGVNGGNGTKPAKPAKRVAKKAAKKKVKKRARKKTPKK